MELNWLPSTVLSPSAVAQPITYVSKIGWNSFHRFVRYGVQKVFESLPKRLQLNDDLVLSGCQTQIPAVISRLLFVSAPAMCNQWLLSVTLQYHRCWTVDVGTRVTNDTGVLLSSPPSPIHTSAAQSRCYSTARFSPRLVAAWLLQRCSCKPPGFNVSAVP